MEIKTAHPQRYFWWLFVGFLGLSVLFLSTGLRLQKKNEKVLVIPPAKVPADVDLSGGVDSIYKAVLGKVYVEQINEDSMTFLLNNRGDTLSFRQKMFKLILDGIEPIQAYLAKVEDGQMTIQIKNTHVLPIQLLDVVDDKSRVLASFSGSMAPARQNSEYRVRLDENFDNLFVSNKNKKAGFDIYTDYKKLMLRCKMPGISTVYTIAFLPWEIQSDELAQAAKLRLTKAYLNFDFLAIDSIRKQVVVKQGTWQLDTAMIIPVGYTFVIPPATHFDFTNPNAKIISYGKVHWVGTPSMPIVFTSANQTGQGILVTNAPDTSFVRHCRFKQLGDVRNDYWSVSGMVNFHKSCVAVEHSHFIENRSEDALNIINATFALSDLTFNKTRSDAFDGDFVKGTVTNCEFMDLGNDGIDVSGSDIFIENITIVNAGDKAVSAGEKSVIRGKNIEVRNSEIGVASKDLSAIFLANLKLDNNKLGFTAFQKKAEFGVATITITDSPLNERDASHLIEHHSALSLNGKKMPTTDGVIEKMYGKLYGKSSK